MLSRRLCEREMLSPPRFPVPPKKVSQMQGHTGGTPATSLYHGVHVFVSTADWVQFVFPCSTGRRPLHNTCVPPSYVRSCSLFLSFSLFVSIHSFSSFFQRDSSLTCVCVVIGDTCNIYALVIPGWRALYSSRFVQARVVRLMHQFGPGTSQADLRLIFSYFLAQA